jgi:hypothetical protein
MKIRQVIDSRKIEYKTENGIVNIYCKDELIGYVEMEEES